MGVDLRLVETGWLAVPRCLSNSGKDGDGDGDSDRNGDGKGDGNGESDGILPPPLLSCPLSLLLFVLGSE